MKFQDLVDMAGYITNGDLDKAMALEIVIVSDFTKDGPILVSSRPGAIKNTTNGNMVLTVMPENIAIKEVKRSQRDGDGFFIPNEPKESVN